MRMTPRLLSTVPFAAGPTMLRLHPRFSSTLLLASASGAFTLADAQGISGARLHVVCSSAVCGCAPVCVQQHRRPCSLLSAILLSPRGAAPPSTRLRCLCLRCRRRRVPDRDRGRHADQRRHQQQRRVPGLRRHRRLRPPLGAHARAERQPDAAGACVRRRRWGWGRDCDAGAPVPAPVRQRSRQAPSPPPAHSAHRQELLPPEPPTPLVSLGESDPPSAAPTYFPGRSGWARAGNRERGILAGCLPPLGHAGQPFPPGLSFHGPLPSTCLQSRCQEQTGC